MQNITKEMLAVELGIIALLILSLVTGLEVLSSYPMVLALVIALTLINGANLISLAAERRWARGRWMLMLALLAVFTFVLGLIMLKALLNMLMIGGIIVMVLLLLAIVFYEEKVARKTQKPADKDMQAIEAIKLSEAISDMNKKSSEVFVASSSGKTFHSADCIVARRIRKDRKVSFGSENEAIRSGYARCRVCLEAR